MNEAKLKLELAGLEQRILGITGDSLDYQHYRRFLDWSRNEMKVNEIEELMSDRCLILNLLFGCHCTPGEVERLEKVNDLLLEMTNRTYHRTADLVRALLVMKKDDMDDDYMIESRLTAGLRLIFQSMTRCIILTRLETAKGGTPKKEMVEKYKLEKLTDKYDYFK